MNRVGTMQDGVVPTVIGITIVGIVVTDSHPAVRTAHVWKTDDKVLINSIRDDEDKAQILS